MTDLLSRLYDIAAATDDARASDALLDAATEIKRLNGTVVGVAELLSKAIKFLNSTECPRIENRA